MGVVLYSGIKQTFYLVKVKRKGGCLLTARPLPDIIALVTPLYSLMERVTAQSAGGERPVLP